MTTTERLEQIARLEREIAVRVAPGQPIGRIEREALFRRERDIAEHRRALGMCAAVDHAALRHTCRRCGATLSRSVTP